MGAIEDFFRSKLLAIPLIFVIAAGLAGLLMNIKLPNRTERVDVCSSRLTGFELLFGAAKANGCPVYRDATVERWGFPFVEKTSYTAEGYGRFYQKCASGIVTRQQLNAGTCPSWASARPGRYFTPRFFWWWNLWLVFGLLLLIRWLALKLRDKALKI